MRLVQFIEVSAMLVLVDVFIVAVVLASRNVVRLYGKSYCVMLMKIQVRLTVATSVSLSVE